MVNVASGMRLIVAGTTPGVRGDDGATVPLIASSGIEQLVASGTATAGMIAKLRACEHALAGGVDDVVIVDGQEGRALEAAAAGGAPEKSTPNSGNALGVKIRNVSDGNEGGGAPRN